MTDLNFTYDNTLDCEVAHHNGYRIKAERDEYPENPFTAWDCNWPISVRSSDRGGKPFTDYEEKFAGPSVREPLRFFNDDQLVHWQVHLAKMFGYAGVRELLDAREDDFDGGNSTEPLPAYCTDAEALRRVFWAEMEDVADSDLFERCVEMFALLDIAAYETQVTGYSQGDWAQVLVVAVPAAVKEFGCTEPPKPADLEYTAKLYGYWAWGDCYGYVIERPAEVDEDGDVIEWEQIDDGSCWGYYGSDHEESGLADAAREALPDEPAPIPAFEAELVDA